LRCWERRGRGWQVWDVAASLEPPLAPFRFHWIARGPQALDDGCRPTLLSCLTDRIVERLVQAGELIGISVLDFVIVAGRGVASLRARQML
jgi:hypothetical protein